MHILQNWLVWHLRALGHAFLLVSRGAAGLLVRGPCLPHSSILPKGPLTLQRVVSGPVEVNFSMLAIKLVHNLHRLTDL